MSDEERKSQSTVPWRKDYRPRGPQPGQEPRSIEAKIDRLRQRIAKATANGAVTPALAAVLAGMLDLLADEL